MHLVVIHVSCLMLTSLAVNTGLVSAPPTTLTSHLLNLLYRECVLSAIEDDALVP